MIELVNSGNGSPTNSPKSRAFPGPCGARMGEGVCMVSNCQTHLPLLKVLFLDIDGVVNCATTVQRTDHGFIGIDPHMAFMIGKIVLDTGCEVVLSSAWRGHPSSESEVRQRVVDFMDRTKHLSSFRGDEVQEWLERHPEVEKYAIVDDGSDMHDYQKPNFFQTSWETGLTKEIAEKITNHLNEK